MTEQRHRAADPPPFHFQDWRLRAPEISDALPVNAAAATALDQGNGIQMRHIARPFASIDYNPSSASNYSITATSLTAVDTTNLRTQVDLSGDRPVRVQIMATVAAPGSQSIDVGVLMDSVELDDFIVYHATTDIISQSGFAIITAENVSPGRHTFDVGAEVSSGTGTIYAGGTYAVRMTVEEM